MHRLARVVRTRFPAGRRVLAISDIHGNLPFLQGVLKAARYGPEDILVLVGDLVEKGPDSLSTLRYIMELAGHNDVYCLRGNCDDLVCDFVREDGEIQKGFYERYLRLWGERCLLLQMGRAAGFVPRGPEDLPALRRVCGSSLPRNWTFWRACPKS